MKKIGLMLCLVGALLVLGYLALAYWVGVQAKAYYGEVLAQANRCGWGTTLVCGNYHHGFFASSARTLVKFPYLGPKAEKPAPFSVELLHSIRHGPLPLWKEPGGGYRFTPLIATVNTKILPVSGSQAGVDELFERPALENFTLMHLGGGWESHFLGTAADDIQLGNSGVGISWRGVNGMVFAAADRDRWTGGCTLPILIITSTEGRFCFERAECRFELHSESRDQLAGEIRLAVQHFDFAYKTGKGSGQCAGGNLESAAVGQRKRDIVQISIRLAVDPLEWNSTLIGNGTVELQLRNLAAEGLARIGAFFQHVKVLSHQLSGTNRGEKVFAEGMKILAGFLKQSPEIELTKLNLETSKGNLSGTGKIAIDGQKTGAYPSPWMLLNALFVDAKVSLSSDLLYYGVSETRAPELLDLFELKGDTFEASLHAQEGRLQLNRRSILLKKFIN